MKETARKKVLILISNRFACTNVIHSHLLSTLAKIYDISILSDIISNSDLLEINQHFQVNIHKLDQILLPEGRWSKFIRKIEKMLFFEHFKIQSFRIKQMRMPRTIIQLLNGLLYIPQCLNINVFLLVQLRKYLIYHSKHYHYAQSLFQFDGVISTSPLDFRENVIINQMHPRTRTMAIVISWDNLTTKGLINANHHLVLVWNKFMAADYGRIYSKLKLPAHRIQITGIPRFDVYFKAYDTVKSKSDFIKKFQYSKEDRILLFATSAHKHFPNQAQILNDLQAYCFHKEDLKILVRCHAADDINHYIPHCKSTYTRLWAPLNETGPDQRMPDIDHLNSLVSMMQNCSVCIQVASTIRLDAMACGKPLISIAYDGDRPQKYSNSVRRYYDYDHQIPLNALQLDRMVYSKEQLFLALDQIIGAAGPQTPTPTTHPDSSAFTHFTKPIAVETSLQYIHTWLN